MDLKRNIDNELLVDFGDNCSPTDVLLKKKNESDKKMRLFRESK